MQAIAQAGIEGRLGFPAHTPDDGFGVAMGPDRALFGFDFVFIKLLMTRQIPKQIEMAQALGQRVIVDVDDFYDDLPESNLAHAATDPALNRWQNRDVFRQVIEAADMVTVTTPFLYDYYAARHPNVRMIRNGVLPHQFEYRKPVNRKPVLGWVGGIPWRGGDLQTMRDWLPDFLIEHDLMFHHAGHADRVPGQDNVPSLAELVGIPPERVTTSPLRPLDEYHQMFSFDIGLVPLTDIPFNHAKSNLKGLEYSCAGVPFIAQGLPEYEYLHNTGVGRVAYTSDDWVRHCTKLLDYGTRKREARTNQVIVAREHSIMAREDEWISVLVGDESVAATTGKVPVPPSHALA